MNRLGAVYTLALTFLALLAAIVSGIMIYLQYSAYIDRTLESKLSSTSQTILQLFDLSDLDYYKDLGLENKELYDDFLGQIDVFKKEYDFAYIYALQPDDMGNYVFIFDTANLEDDESEASFLEVYENIPPEVGQAYQSGRAVFSEPYTDRWGTFRSIYTPIIDNKGHVTAVLGLDIELNHIQGFKRKARMILLLSIFTALILSFIIGRWISKALTRPYESARMQADQSKQHFKGLFYDTPVPLWEEDFSKAKRYLDKIRQEYNSDDIESLILEHPGIWMKCLALVEVLDINPATVKLLEMKDKRQLQGSLIKDENAKKSKNFIKEIKAIWNGEYSLEFEMDIVTHEGNLRKVLLKWFVPQGSREDYSRVIIAMSDLTEMKTIQNQLQQSQKMQAIGQLAGGVAHDFNNILVGIMGYAELSLLLIDEQKDPSLQEYLQNILIASERAKELVSKILSFSRQGNKELKSIELNPIVQEVIDLLKVTLPSSIKSEISIEDESIVIWGNPTIIHEVIMNLANNAAQSMLNKGTLEITLEKWIVEAPVDGILGIIEPDSYAVISIKDSGEGIKKENIDHIFEPFFTTKKERKGTGLGLSVVYGIMQTLKGNILVQSTESKGSCFELFIPLSNTEIEKSSDSKEDILTDKNERILLVDDDKLVLKMHERMLESLGYQVESTDKSKTALKRFKQSAESFDLLLSDQTMPKMTGFELSKSILKEKPHFPIILCTGYSSTLDRDAALTLGVKAILNKPVNRNELSIALKKALG